MPLVFQLRIMVICHLFVILAKPTKTTGSPIFLDTGGFNAESDNANLFHALLVRL